MKFSDYVDVYLEDLKPRLKRRMRRREHIYEYISLRSSVIMDWMIFQCRW